VNISKRLRRTARSVVDSAVARPPYVRSGHFYSPLTSADDVQRALKWGADVPGVDLRADEQVNLFGDLVPLFYGVPERRYDSVNGMYGPADAAVYQAMTRWYRPRRVVEVGSGFSTAKLLDTAEVFLPDLQLTCVEPFPDRLLALLTPDDKVEVLAKPVQDAPLEMFTTLESGDILFIDSTHVAKAGSDVVWLFLRILPRLAQGVIVHVHDVFWPFEYPQQWLREGRDWNEDYILHAFLCHNEAWRIELFSSWVWHDHPELVPDGLGAENPGSIWLRRC
jgi:predicted O-methyltransferase YrrM